MRIRAALFLIAAAALLVGCGGSSGEQGATAMSSSGSDGGESSVAISDYVYEPADLTVPAGTTVTFTNEDAAPHTATSKDPDAFDSGSIETGKRGSITLEETGTFTYYCAFHPFMTGTITVE